MSSFFLCPAVGAGITAACTLRKSAMILTTSAVAVDQWRKQFEEYTTIDCSRLLTLTAETKQVGQRGQKERRAFASSTPHLTSVFTEGYRMYTSLSLSLALCMRTH